MVIINSFRYPESNIKYQQRQIRVILDKNDLGQGTLFVSQNTFCWQQTNDSGFTISYTDISLHAISKDQNVYPKECLYIILDGSITIPGASNKPDHDEGDNEENSEEEESQSNVTEILLVPEEDEDTNSRIIKEMYEHIKLCQALNPDPEFMEEEDDDDHLYEDAEGETEEELNETLQQERGGGDADIDELSHRIQHSGVNITYNYTNGDEDEFQDAD